ncbi:winged helix DNA-binding protein [Altererythrobacter sp. H2]|uniref:winged helix DNA-binding protein n=1 Tax=Altererythrobacter sp. H2 TaxID=3108391 RepID=UPI002B4BB647|nr:winged helix DNA-binding protein [Altererythrobacter sp. H2]WRK96718.1 winged helix DNA-binding protein [Altererythrobacter sp. H2]
MSDSDQLRTDWCEDADMAGLALAHFGPLSEEQTAADGDLEPTLGDMVVVDCPGDEPAALAALASLDMRAARAGSEMVVATTPGALDAVFACLDQSRAEILVDPSRGERVVALGWMMARSSGARLRDISDDDRLSLLRLTEQVAEIAERLERLGQQGLGAGGGAFRFESPGQAFRSDADAERTLLNRPRPPLPDPRLVRRIIQQRQLRAKYFDGELFADPAWDMLLDLTAARAEHTRVSVTSLCIASAVPPTTALRWISQMVDAGLLERQQDEVDRRRAFIALTDKAADAMARYFAELGRDAAGLV